MSLFSPPVRTYAEARTGSRWTTWSTSLPLALRTRWIRSARSQPDFVSANVEMTMSSTRKYWSAFMIAVYGSGSPIIPAAVRSGLVQAAEHQCQPGPRAARGGAVTALLRHEDDEQPLAHVRLGLRLGLSASSSSSPLAVRLATASVTWNDSPSVSMSATTCSTGSPDASRMRSIRSRRSQPDRAAGNVEMMIPSGSYSRNASIAAAYGSGSPTSPTASIPSERTKPTARSTRI